MKSSSLFPVEFQLSDGGATLKPSERVYFPIGSYALAPDGRPRHLLMLGGSLLQLPAIRMAREEGWKIILADGNADALARPWVDYFEHVDLKDRDGLLLMARRYFERGCLHAVFTAATDFSASVAWVSEALGLPGIPFEVALNASNKLRMRRIFQEKGIPSPAFVEIASGEAEPLAAITKLTLPVVVKPIDNMGARGVKRLDDWSELGSAIADARGFSRHGSVLIEEFIQGSEYSIDSLVVDGKLIPCGVAIRHVCFPPHFVEVGHTLPSDLLPSQEKQLIEVFSAAVAALGITNGCAKGDVFFTPQGPMIGEIAARLSGGYMSGWTFPLSSGLELTRAALYVAMGLALPVMLPTLQRVSAERALIAIPGRVAVIDGVDQARAAPAIEAVFMRTQIGDRTIFPRNNVEKAGNVIAVHADRQTACRLAEAAVAQVFFRMQAADAVTDAWMFDRKSQSVGAYLLLRKQLESMMTNRPVLAEKIDFKNSVLLISDFSHQLMDQNILAEKDWSWRSLQDCLGWITAQNMVEFVARKFSLIDLVFWSALATGGLSGAIYVIDTVTALNGPTRSGWLKSIGESWQK